MSASRGEALELISALLKALSHKVRTPLSVISNDLSYFETLLKKGETDRPAEKIKLINQIFLQCAELGNGKPEFISATWEEIVSELTHHTAGASIDLSKAGAKPPRCDPKLIGLALKLLCETLLLSKLCTLPIKISIIENQIFFRGLHLGSETGMGSVSLTELFCRRLLADTYYPPIIDAIFSAHGWRTEMRGKGGTNFDLAIIY